jgi:hypothetical protein
MAVDEIEVEASSALREVCLNTVHDARVAHHGLGTQSLRAHQNDGFSGGVWVSAMPARGCPLRRRLGLACTCDNIRDFRL